MKLSHWIQKTDVDTQKVDFFSLETCGIIITTFIVVIQFGRLQFFQKTFLFTNINMKVVLHMLFINFSNADI